MKNLLVTRLTDTSYLFWEPVTLSLSAPPQAHTFPVFSAIWCIKKKKNPTLSCSNDIDIIFSLSLAQELSITDVLLFLGWNPSPTRPDVHTGSLACLHSYPSISMAGCPLKQGTEPISTRQRASPVLAPTGTGASDTACPWRFFLVGSMARVGPRVSLQGPLTVEFLIAMHYVHSVLSLIREEMNSIISVASGFFW